MDRRSGNPMELHSNLALRESHLVATERKHEYLGLHISRNINPNFVAAQKLVASRHLAGIVAVALATTIRSKLPKVLSSAELPISNYGWLVRTGRRETK